METQTSAKQPLWMAGLITQSMSGRPASGLMFFLGMDTEPPRAGIIAITRGLGVAIAPTVGALFDAVWLLWLAGDEHGRVSVSV